MGKKFLPFLFSSFVRAICVREGANECWHYTGINHDLVVNTLGDNCGRYLKASEWIIFPNYFQDESIEDAEARLNIISESLPHLDYEQSELTCALMFPKCQRNICSTNLASGSIESDYHNSKDMLPKTVAKITEPDTEETRRHAKPKVRLMGNIHGNEDQGIFILLPLIRDILDGTQEYALLRKSLELHFLISANPDGYLRARATYRSNGKICWEQVTKNNVMHNDEIGALLMNFHDIKSLYTNTKQLLVHRKRARGNAKLNKVDTKPELCTFRDDSFWCMGRVLKQFMRENNRKLDFVKLHKTLIKQEPCMHGADEFSEKGITNGAAWYSTIGTLQDFEYIAEGVMSFTLELGCEKTTSKANLPVIYSDAKDAMIDFMLWGKIEDEKGRGIPKAEVFIQEKFWNGTTALNPLSTLTDDDGHYNKLFWPDDMTASITLFIQHEKYRERRFPFTDEYLASLKNFRSCRRTYSSLTDSSCNYELPKALVIKLHKL
ncbi:Oidioi.mRNA.OKI2018_I69.chr1.g2174.t1.cds [Oikopleura dioica]|uniref:Oidioi.mRNA.OKI2018_I69.chr1.g2174.t1.cds n=1 Tax=Oikopleura dioica TaxID=34765 RepID=A0ABN7SQB0_OIKDI|nr:Oidioi.mRNA.OKI2018_I69.chr1.g2174.t1.cds [Oikopleura dioica]